MNIPDKATEAAEKAIQMSREEWHPTTMGPGLLARIALEAAYPFIAAQALRDVISKPGMYQRQNTDYGYVEETVYSREMLAARAHELDPQ